MSGGLGPAGRARALPEPLVRQAKHIESVAREAGLDFFPVVFEYLDARDVNGIAAYGGFPVRYPSWRFGMEFERLEKGYEYGLSKIYELVVNTDPVRAYLVSSNSDLEQKLVMAHVFGHADFFKHNTWFADTDRSMLDTMASFGTRLRRSIDQQGLETVESFLDAALSLDTLIDPYHRLRARLRPSHPRRGTRPPSVDGSRPPAPRTSPFQISTRTGRLECSRRAERRAATPTHDVLGFLEEHAPLEDWQREILHIVRAEALYFQPQRMTKIMNEGWASYWHSKLLTGGLLEPSEIVDFADCHSGATLQAPGQVNPYKLGIELFRYAESKGLDLFELRHHHNDASLIDLLFDEEFCGRNELFLFGRNPRSGRQEIVDRDWKTVKDRLLQDLAWGGLPQLELVDVDGSGDGELLLEHHHDGRDLHLDSAGETLRNLAKLWAGPAHLLTQEDGRGRRLICEEGELSVHDEVDPGASEAGPALGITDGAGDPGDGGEPGLGEPSVAS